MEDAFTLHPDAMTPESESGSPPQTVKPVLLVVDDEESVCSSLDLVFSDQFEIAVAQTGPEALEKVRDLAPNLMLLDLRLPEMHGLDVLDRAKAADPALEIIVITAVQEIETAVDAMRRGAFTYIIKPFDVDHLRDLADRALTKHRINLDNRRMLESLNQKNSRLRLQRHRLKHRLHAAVRALHETREELLQASRLVTLGEVAATLAHEIRNPLTVISSYVQLLRIGSDLPNEEYLNRVESELRRLNRLMQQLLRLASPAPTRAMLVDINQLIRDALGLIRPKVDVQGISVVTHLVTPPPRTTADPDQMVQLLLNLLLNACQAMLKGGTLEISTTIIPHPEGGGGEWIEILVRDTGAGIPPEVLPKIFEPFFSTKRQSEGAGLGLAVVQKLVENLGGRIEVDSQVGVGTVFRLLIPRMIAPPPGYPVKREAEPPASPG